MNSAAGTPGSCGVPKWDVEKERPSGLRTLLEIGQRLLVQERLIFLGPDVGNDSALLDDRADVAGVGEAAEISKPT